MPKQTVILDSSQISTLGECEEKWRLENVEHLIHINKKAPDDSNRPPDFISAGSLGHKYQEIYYRTLGLTQDQAAAAKEALAFDPDAADFVDQHEFPLDPFIKKQIRQRFCDYLLTYGARDYIVINKRIPTIKVGDDGMLYDCFEYIPLVEQGFSYHLYEDRDYLFILEGRIDVICESHGTTIWMDHKWQFRERELYKKSIQFKNYALVTGLDLGVINYVRLHKELNPKTTFVRQPISFSGYERRMWKQELIENYFMPFAKKLANGNKFKAEKSACGGKFGYPCEFTPICEEYNLVTREAVKKRDFTQRKEWKPW